MISINDLAIMALQLVGKGNAVDLVNIEGPVGVMGRSSDNEMIEDKLGWRPSEPLVEGMRKTLQWIEVEIAIGYNKA